MQNNADHPDDSSGAEVTFKFRDSQVCIVRHDNFTAVVILGEEENNGQERAKDCTSRNSKGERGEMLAQCTKRNITDKRTANSNILLRRVNKKQNRKE